MGLEMTFEKVVMWMILLHLIGHSLPAGENGIYNIGAGYDWNEALKLCDNKSASLPDITIRGNGFGLVCENLKRETPCFWVSATYERAVNLTDADETYPKRCCDVVFTDKNNSIRKYCINCTVAIGYFCASGNNTISNGHINYATWSDAHRDCARYAQGLPSDTNKELLTTLPQEKPFWVNSVRRVNLHPKHSDGMYAFCYCNGTIYLKCPVIPGTICILETKNERNRHTTESCLSPLNLSKNSMDDTTTSEKDESTSSSITYRDNATGNGTLVGSLIGAAVAFVVIFTIGMIVIVKWIRRKRRANDDIKPEIQINTRSNKKVPPPKKPSYDIVLEDDLEMDTTNTASPQKQTVLREPVLHTQSQNIKQLSIRKKDDNRSVHDKEPPLYSTVQKEHKRKTNAEAIKEWDDSNSKYDKIDFEKRSVSESARHVYNKANIHRLGHNEEQDANVYNKADFICKTFDKIGSSVYDKENCSRVEGSDYDITYDMKVCMDQTYNHI